MKTVRIGGAIAGGFGFLALLGWALGLPFLASLGADKIPMAPSTALLFVLYGIAALLRARLPLSRGAHRVGVVVNAAGALVALPLLILSFLGIRPVAERLGFAVAGAVGDAPVGHMSPVTALGFLLASLSFLGSLPSSSSRPWRAETAWWSGCLLVVTSSVLILAYVYGAPLFYAGSFIPPAATTSLAFAAIGTALLALAGREAGPPGRTAGPPARVPYPLVLVFVLFAAGIVTVGGLYVRSHGRHYRAEVERQLSVVAELKTSELAQWRAERLGDATVFLDNAAFAALVRRVFDNPQDAEARTRLRTWLTRAQAHYTYDRVSLLDGRGAERMAVPEGRAPASSVVVRRVPEVLRSGQVSFEDFYRDEHDQRIYLTVLVPILEGRSRALGIVALRIDPETYLYPFINRWPTPAQTAETLLVRRDGTDALFLSELKFQKHTALTLRIPLANQDVAAVKAARGDEGIVEGRDYRGLPVIAALRVVPGSPWSLVARMDAAEVNAPLRERLWVMVMLVGGMLAAAAAGVGILWREQRVRHFRERYEAERERRSAEARYRALFEQSPDGVLLIDAETGKTLAANEAAHKQLGYTREEFAALRISDYEALETPEETQRHIQKVLSEGSDDFETLQRTKNGEIRNVHVWTKTLPLGQRLAFYCIFQDITERKRTEAALREREHLLSESQRIAHIGSWLSDLTGRMTWSDETYRIYGVSPDTFSPNAESVIALVHPDDRPALRAWRDACAAEAKPGELEFRINRPDGTVRFLSGRGELQYDAGNRPTHMAGTVQDITERKRAEEALRESEARFRSAFEESGTAMALQDLGGRYLRVNRALCALLGYSEAELLATAFQAATHPEDVPGDLDRRRMLTAGETPTNQREKRYFHKSGRVVWALVSASVVRDPEGQPAYFVVQAQDVTERKEAEASRSELEAQLQSAQKLEAVGQLAGGVAHDFNNLLTVILGRSELLLHRADLDDQVRKNIALIQATATHAAAVTRQLLAFSRKQVVTPTVVDLNARLTGVRQILRRLIGEDVELAIVPAPALGHVTIDPAQVEQILLNLAVNARDAMPAGGRLTLETANVELDEGYARAHAGVQPGSYVMLAVSDTGTGMDAATQARIFEPFFTTKGPGKGTGLGLAVVYGIVRQSGGTIWVYSEPGRGTTFKIYLPRVEEPAEARRESAPASSVLPRGSETLLLVEDEAGVRELTREILQGHGYTVLEAGHAGEALVIADTHRGPIHLLVTDVVMPHMNGRELADRLRRRQPTLKVLFMSGYTDDAIVRHGVLEQGVPFLQKPFTPDRLTRTVREVLDAPDRGSVD